MPVLRGGVTADQYNTPDIYIEELVPKVDEKPAGISGKVMGIIGQFQKGSVNDVLTVNGDAEFIEKLGDFSEQYSGSKAAWTAFKRGVKKIICVNVRGAGAGAASLTLKDKAGTPADTLKISYKGPGLYGNNCTVEVLAGSGVGTFKIVLKGPTTKTETYDNLTSPAMATSSINQFSKEFAAENLSSTTVTPNNNPAVLAATKLTGGSDGTAPTATHYKGTTDSSTGKKSGLELLKTSVEVTDVVTDIYVSDTMNGHMWVAAELMNWFAYLPLAVGTSVSAAITNRGAYNTEFAHLCIGHARSKSRNWTVPVAVYDAIAHILTPVQDGTAGFSFADVSGIDVELSADDIETLTTNQVVSMGQMLNSERQLVYGMKSDFTLDSDPRFKQTYRRRVTSLLEKDYYIVMTPYRSKHISKSLLEDAELVSRSYLDKALGEEIIQAYTIKFTTPEEIGNIDELIEDLVIDLYNIADKIRIRLLSAANAIGGGEVSNG
ncbi:MULTISPECIES: hypothetical protein [unclassified Paenibacillus]|uniref:hypothetical protein n=1 Tax=unclassified Paenibacillus TaxID=185978 RepID=UPI00362869E9